MAPELVTAASTVDHRPDPLVHSQGRRLAPADPLRNLRRAAAIFDARSVPLVLNQALEVLGLMGKQLGQVVGEMSSIS